MASSITLSSSFLPSQHSNSSRVQFKPYSTSTFKLTSFATKIRASSTAFSETKPTEPVIDEKDVRSSKNILACPICYEPVTLIGATVLSVDSARGSSLQCSTCKKTYSGKETHLELTVASGSKEYGDAMPLATEFFRDPTTNPGLVNLWLNPFTAPDIWNFFEKIASAAKQQEILQSIFELMKDYLKPVLGGNILDASCGSGLFSRLFAKSGLFSLVTALDYSENMLQQCYEFIKQEENFPKENLILVRADIARLPFISGSLDAIHAGAAIHCWPSPSAAVAEVSRVLRPGGVFVATTYILDGHFSFIPFLKPISQKFAQVSGSNFFLSERELEDVCRACGLVDFTCTRNRRFVMFSATKPS